MTIPKSRVPEKGEPGPVCPALLIFKKGGKEGGRKAILYLFRRTGKNWGILVFYPSTLEGKKKGKRKGGRKRREQI